MPRAKTSSTSKTAPLPEETTVAPVKAGSKTKKAGPSLEEISRRAYEIYQARGGEHGRHEEDWQQAERELKLGPQ
jgi:hypothetical protein